MNKRLYPSMALALVLLLVAVIGYAVPGQGGDPPVRILLDNMAGNIVFDHQVHAQNYGLDCRACHHPDLDPARWVTPCGACHLEDSTSTYRPNRMAAFHEQCLGCHEESGLGPYTGEDCNLCHFK